MLCSQKGGAGKTTTTLHLAAECYARGETVIVIDDDPQGSAVAWAKTRGPERPPSVYPAQGRAAEIVEAAKADGIDFVLIDTEPRASARVLQLARLVDLPVVIARPTALDLHAAMQTVQALQGAGHLPRVVLNGAVPRVPETEEARQFFTQAGAEVWPGVLHHRVNFQRALSTGTTVSELEPKGEGAREIKALADWIMAISN
jgi:chromosome partitioning protein